MAAAEAWLRQEKVKKFEDFVNRRLKPDLGNAIAQRDQLFQQQKSLPDTRHIFVDIGLGFHVEFTWQEALQFISVREARLARQIDEYTHLIASIKAQIKMTSKAEGGGIASRPNHSLSGAGDFFLLLGNGVDEPSPDPLSPPLQPNSRSMYSQSHHAPHTCWFNELPD
ncbi:hypothetical protein ABZP36_035925 [Zizania latifolia]